MGSYCTLNYGQFEMGMWKSHVPLEVMLLFTQQDYAFGKEDGSETYRFVTTTAAARQRIDRRGVTLAVCRGLFERYRADVLRRYELDPFRVLVRPNDVTFERYLTACRHAFKKHKCWYKLGSEPEPSKLVKAVFSDGFFNDQSRIYFCDAQQCILMRSFLEVAPDDCEIVLDLSELVLGGYIDLKETPNLYEHWTRLLLQRLDVDYQLYGFVVDGDPNVDRRLREVIATMIRGRVH